MTRGIQGVLETKGDSRETYDKGGFKGYSRPRGGGIQAKVSFKAM